MTPDIDQLLSQLADYPDDDKLLAIIALYYMEHPDGDKDLEYFERAYQVNSSIENTHNLAFWLHHEYGEPERGLLLQKQVMKRQPQSYFPYVSYAQMLLAQNYNEDGVFTLRDVKHYEEVISTYQLALDKIDNIAPSYRQSHLNKTVFFYKNIACAYAMIDNFEQAFTHFDRAQTLISELLTDDFSSISAAILEEKYYEILLDKARLYILLGDGAEALTLLNEARHHGDCCHLTVASLYSRLAKYNLAAQLTENEVVHESWDWVWYAVYQSDRDKWRKIMSETLQNAQQCLVESQLEAEQYRIENKQQPLKTELNFIDQQQAKISNLEMMLAADNHPKPQDDIKQELRSMYFGCLLFGCERHRGLIDDSNLYYWH